MAGAPDPGGETVLLDDSSALHMLDGLPMGVLVLDQMGGGVKTRTADAFLYRLALSLSCAYLLLILLSILVQPFAPFPPLELMQQSNLWLGPLQGLVAGALGAFFTKAN